MEITAPIVSNFVCFRCKPKGLTEPELDKLNKMIFNDLNQISFGWFPIQRSRAGTCYALVMSTTGAKNKTSTS